jgi:lipoprotein-releasing system permease protein
LVAERFISKKLKFQGNVAAVAIAVSFFVIIVAVAVSSGFRHEIREGVAAMTGDISISPFPSGTDEPESLPVHLPQEEAIRALPGVRDIVPVAVRAGIVKNGEIVHGVIVKGIPDPVGNDGSGKVGNDGSGKVGNDAGSDRPSLSVSIPQRLSEIMGLGEGDDLTTYFVGEKLRVRKFHIASVHRDLIELDDNLLVYASLEDLQRLNGWEADEASSLEVRLTDNANQEVLELEIGTLLEDYYVSSSKRTYPQVFDWLNLLDFNVVIILILMTVVAGFNMVSGLLIMLLRNISTVGTLKTLGMDNRAIGRLFVRIGAEAVLKGMLIGNAAALLFCLLQGTTHLIPLDPANYFVAWVPVRVNLLWILGADAVAFIGILLLLWIPTRVIARIDPAQTVKAD